MSLAVPVGAWVESMLRLVRMCSTHGGAHPMARAVGEEALEATALLREIAGGTPALQFVTNAVFCNGQLVPVGVDTFQHVRDLSVHLARHEAHEITFGDGAGVAGLVELASQLAHPGAEPIPERGYGGLKVRAIDSVSRGESAEEVPPQVFAATQLALAMGDVERLVRESHEPWDVRRGLSVVRRVEAAWSKAGRPAGALLERAPGEWDVPRRSLAVAWHASALCTGLELGRSIRRALVHASLILAVHGMTKRGARACSLAAEKGASALEEAPQRRSGIDPHRQRVATVLFAVRTEGLPLPAADLLRTAYEIEKARRPTDVDFDLSLPEILGHLASEMGRSQDATWIRLLVRLLGAFPVGSKVQLSDGRVGVVVGEGEGLSRPQVMVEGSMHIPSNPVRPFVGARP